MSPAGNMTPGALQSAITAAEQQAWGADLAVLQGFQTQISTTGLTAVQLGQELNALPGQLANPQMVTGAQGLAGILAAFMTNLNTMITNATANAS